MSGAEERVFKAVELGLIEIDEQGRVWKIARQQTSRWGHATKIVSCPRKRAEKNGEYLQVRVMFDGIRHIATAHRLVWFSLYGSIPAGLTINHKDGKKHNNRPDNLELATTSEQMLHAMHVLGHKPFHGCRRGSAPGARNGQAKLTEVAANKIKKSTEKGVVLARRFGVRTSTISRIRNGKMWAHLNAGAQ